MGIIGLTIFVLAAFCYVHCKLDKIEDDIDNLYRKGYEA